MKLNPGSSGTSELDILVLSLWRARKTGKQVKPRRLSETQASYVMGRLLGLALDAGEIVIGWKLGLTNSEVRKQLGAPYPFIAPVFASSLRPPTLGRLRAPNLEVEFVGKITNGALPQLGSWSIGIEIVDTHIRGPFLYPLVIADWGLHAAASIGTECRAPLPGQRVALRIATPISTVELQGVVPEVTRLDTLLVAATIDWPRRVVEGDLLWTGSLGRLVPIKIPGKMSAEVVGFGSASLEFLP